MRFADGCRFLFTGFFGVSSLLALPLFAEEPLVPTDESAPAITAAPAEVATPPGPATPPASVLIDDVAEQRYRACLDFVKASEVEAARACFREVIATAPGTSAALQAATALFVLDARLDAPTVAPSNAARVDASASWDSVGILPGRLGTGLASGLLGAFTGITGGAILGNSPLGRGGNPQLWIGGIGASAVVLGAAGGLGGYLLGEILELDEADARLIGSSLAWGAAFGGYLGFGAAVAIPSDTSLYNVPVGVGTLLCTTWVAAIAGAAVASQLELTSGQVGLLNSGGLIGWLWGQAIADRLKAPSEPYTGGPGPVELALGQSLPIPAGLLVGGVLAGFLDMSWGEALLCDLGGVLGLVAGGALSLAGVSGWGLNLVWPAAGATTGWVLSLAGMTLWRVARGASASSSGSEGSQASAWRLTLPALFDRNGRAVPGLGVEGVF